MKGLNKYEGSDTISWSDETLYDLDFCLSKVGDMPLKVDLDNLTYGSEHKSVTPVHLINFARRLEPYFRCSKSTLAYTAYASRILKKLVVHDANNEQKIYACGELLVRWLIWLNPRIARPQDRPFKAVKLPQSQKHSDGTFTHKFELNTKYTGYFCQHSLLPKDISGQFVHPFESLTGYTVVLSVSPAYTKSTEVLNHGTNLTRTVLANKLEHSQCLRGRA